VKYLQGARQDRCQKVGYVYVVVRYELNYRWFCPRRSVHAVLEEGLQKDEESVQAVAEDVEDGAKAYAQLSLCVGKQTVALTLAAFVVIRNNIKHMHAVIPQLVESRREVGDDDVTITQEIFEQVASRAKVTIENLLVDVHLPYGTSGHKARVQLRWTPIR